jgi:hypothetical protein
MAKKLNPIIDDSDIQNFKSVEKTVTSISSTLSDIVGNAKEFSRAFAKSEASLKSLSDKIYLSIKGFDKLSQDSAKFVEKIKQGTASYTEFTKLQAQLKDKTAGINKTYQNSFELLKKTSNSQADISKQAGKLQAINDANVELLTTQADIAQKIRQLNNTSAATQRRALADDILKSKQKEKELTSTLNIVQALQETIDNNKKLDKLYTKIGTSFDKMVARSRDIQKILETVSKIPILKNFVNLEKLKTVLEKAKGETNLLKLAFKESFSQFGAALKTPLVQFGIFYKILTTTLKIYKDLFKTVLEQDKAITEMGKSIGIAKDQSVKLYENFAAYALTTNKAYITSIDLVKANNELNELLGSGVAFTGEILDNYVTFTKAIGLSKESFVGLNLLAQQNGQTFEATEKSIIRTVNRQILQGKVTANYRKVIEQVGKISANISMSFGSIPSKIAEGILAAKQFGATLEQSARIGESLLDFQSSIESELQAELITGKQINLERARAAYLYNDQATFLREINREIGTFKDFQDMNQIQRQIYAKSFGMQKDEMAEMLKMAELEKQYSGLSAKTAQEQLKTIKKENLTVEQSVLNSIKERALQEQILDLTTKIKQTFIDIAQGPIGMMLKGLVGILQKIDLVSKGIGKMLGGSDIGKTIGAIVASIPIVVPAFLMAAKAFSFFTRGTFANPMVTTNIGTGGGGMADTVINPMTGRSIKTSGKTYKDLVRRGIIKPQTARKLSTVGKLGKKVPYLGALMMGLDFAGEMGTGKSAGEAALGTVDQNKFGLAGAGIGAGIGAFFGGVGALPGAGIGYGVGSLVDMFAPRAFTNEMPVEDFVIKPLKKDTIVAAGGTNLGRTDEMVSLLQQLVGTVKAGNKIDINSKTLVTYQNMGGISSTAIA